MCVAVVIVCFAQDHQELAVSSCSSKTKSRKVEASRSIYRVAQLLFFFFFFSRDITSVHSTLKYENTKARKKKKTLVTAHNLTEIGIKSRPKKNEINKQGGIIALRNISVAQSTNVLQGITLTSVECSEILCANIR